VKRLVLAQHSAESIISDAISALTARSLWFQAGKVAAMSGGVPVEGRSFDVALKQLKHFCLRVQEEDEDEMDATESTRSRERKKLAKLVLDKLGKLEF